MRADLRRETESRLAVTRPLLDGIQDARPIAETACSRPVSLTYVARPCSGARGDSSRAAV